MQQDYKNLPMFKAVDIVENNDLFTFRKGEKPMFNIVKLLVLAGIGVGGYYTFMYVLPTVFVALGQLLAAVITGLSLLFLIMMMPVIFKGMRRVTRMLHKNLIKYDPFGELYDGVRKMYGHLDIITNAIKRIKGLEDDTKNKALEYEKKSNDYNEFLKNAQREVEKIRQEKTKITNRLGESAQHDDEFVKMYLKETELLAQTNNIVRQKTQAEDLIVKYGMRHDRMKKTRQKLLKVHSSTKIKIAETETSVKILETDYNFAKEGAAASRAAVEATKGLEGSWTTQYAIEVATSSISADLQEMSMNLKEIDQLTLDFDVDNDTMYERLLKVTDDLKIKEPISADKYIKGNFTPTHDEILKSGLSELF